MITHASKRNHSLNTHLPFRRQERAAATQVRKGQRRRRHGTCAGCLTCRHPTMLMANKTHIEGCWCLVSTPSCATEPSVLPRCLVVCSFSFPMLGFTTMWFRFGSSNWRIRVERKIAQLAQFYFVWHNWSSRNKTALMVSTLYSHECKTQIFEYLLSGLINITGAIC